MRDSYGVEAVGCHLGKVSLNPSKVLVLPPLIIGTKSSVGYAFDVELFVARGEEFSLGLQANLRPDRFGRHAGYTMLIYFVRNKTQISGVFATSTRNQS